MFEAFRRQKAHHILEQANREHAAFQKEMDAQNALLEEAHLAKECYKKDKDIKAAIEKFEDLEKRGLVSSWNELFLADLYVKAGMHDRAWGYLNSLVIKNAKTGSPPIEKIRAAQEKILKKEGK